MAIALFLQFDGMKQDKYDAVMRELGLKINSKSPEGWPKGIISHLAGETETGWAVTDVWESQADFDRFMESRLRPAFAKLQLAEPRVSRIQIYNRYDAR